jgi:hypothetical protein
MDTCSGRIRVHGSGDMVLEGLPVLEQSLLVRLRPMGSALVIEVNRRGAEAIGSGDPARYATDPLRSIGRGRRAAP